MARASWIYETFKCAINCSGSGSQAASSMAPSLSSTPGVKATKQPWRRLTNLPVAVDYNQSEPKHPGSLVLLKRWYSCVSAQQQCEIRWWRYKRKPDCWILRSHLPPLLSHLRACHENCPTSSKWATKRCMSQPPSIRPHSLQSCISWQNQAFCSSCYFVATCRDKRRHKGLEVAHFLHWLVPKWEVNTWRQPAGYAAQSQC